MYYLYSKSCEYAIRILTLVCREGCEDRFSVKEMCRKAKLPEAYARKAMQSLARAKVLKALRGPGGGYRLTCSPKKISILKIIAIIDGEETFEKCVMGLPECGHKNPCPLHEAWNAVKDKYLSELQCKTLFDMIQTQQSPKDK